MTLTQKLVLYALAVALLPLAASGFTLVRLGEDAMRARIQRQELTAAQAVAQSVGRGVQDLGERTVTVLSVLDPLAVSEPEREGLLRLLMGQSPAVRAAAVLEASGKPLAQVARDGGSGGTESPEPAAATLARLRDNLPPMAAVLARPGEALVGSVYFPAGGPASVVLAAGCSVAGGRSRAVVAQVLELDAELLGRVKLEDDEPTRVVVVDGFGRVIAHPTLAAGADLSGHSAVKALVRGGPQASGGTTRYQADDGGWAAAFAKIPELGWGVIVEQPEERVFADAARMRTRTLTWLTVTTAVVALTALLFAVRLRRRLAHLMLGVRSFARGRFAERVAVGGPDELGELATTLNGMAAELESSLTELETWSRTLEERVEARTRELRDAQAQLLLQSKLAAIGQLGAGVAHEVNNPLAGILGYAQLLLRKHGAGDPDQHALERIQEAALRCKTITQNLLRFSQRGSGGRSPVDVNALVGEVVDLLAGGLSEAGLKVVRTLEPDAGVITADPGQLSLVLVNLMSNARNATTSGGAITITTSGDADTARITVADDGHGIEPEHLPRLFDPFFTTKKNWTGVGLGLSVAYRVVTDHGGRIDVDSHLGQGSRFTVVLPRQPPAAAAEAPPPRRPSLLA